MTEGIMKLTKKQADLQVECFSTLFAYARLLSEEQIRNGRICTQEDRDNNLFLNVDEDEIYLDGVELKALETKSQTEKLELAGKDIFQVIAKYVEVDGKPCVIEMMKPIDKNAVFSRNGREKLVSKLAQNNEEVYNDTLTDTFNRRYFEETLKNTIFSGGVVMIDLDDFKIYNNTQGYDTGDAVLNAVVSVIKGCIRGTDTLIRYGGDEFLLLMPQSRPNGVESVIRRVQDAVQAARVPSHPELRLSVSIGGVCDVQPLTEAIRQADVRMYRNKENG